MTLPAKDAATVAESGRPASAARGVNFLHIEPGRATYEVQSDSYTFRSGIQASMVLIVLKHAAAESFEAEKTV